MAGVPNIELSPGLTTSLETLLEHEVPCLTWALLRGPNGMKSQAWSPPATSEMWQNGKPGAGLLWPTSPSLTHTAPLPTCYKSVLDPLGSCCNGEHSVILGWTIPFAF